MDMNYKPNSNKYKEEQAALAAEDKKIEKVVTGPVKRKKKNGFVRFLHLFFPEDRDIKTYITQDVIIPAVKKTISDAVDAVLFPGGSRSKRPSTLASNVSYTKYWEKERTSSRDLPVARVSYDYDDVVLESRGEAERVLDQLCDILENYDFVTVADLYESVGISAVFTDNNFGWSNLSTAEVVRLRGGDYMLKLPRPVPRKK